MLNPFAALKTRIEEDERERLEAARLMEEAQAESKNSPDYMTAKRIVESFMAFRPKATVNEFYSHFFSRKEAETLNPFLPLIVIADLNEKNG